MVPNLWTKEELELLKVLYPNGRKEDILKVLKGRSWNAIERKTQILGIKRHEENTWSDTDIQKLIKLYKKPASKEEIIEAFPGRSWNAIGKKSNRLGLEYHKPEYEIIEGGEVKADLSKKGDSIKFGIVSDTHLGSKYTQITYLKQFYKRCEEEKCEFMVHAGDLSEGDGSHYIGQKFEMYVHGADALKDHIIEHYPLSKKIKTYIIAGFHDLDLWTHSGYDILKMVCKERTDMVYLGHASATLNVSNIKIQLQHPSGGTAYALSYQPQKKVEAFSSENKPHILIIGHYHKAEYLPVLRNVYCFQAGAFQAQTPFAVRKGIFFHYGGWIVEMRKKKEGLASVKAEFVPFYVPVQNDYLNYTRGEVV